MRGKHVVIPILAVAVAALLPSSAAASPPLRAGAGQADITPPQKGYFLGGWTRADRLALGQITRLYANTIVLQRGKTKIALVAAELFAIPAGLQEDVAARLKGRGFNKKSVILAASHTHSGPGGFFNNPTYNTAAPSLETATDVNSFISFFQPAPADPQLYTFLIKQIAQSIRRADTDLAPAEAAWGRSELTHLTQNRSIEAHLRDHGITVSRAKANPGMDPDGRIHTISPDVDVLRVDKVIKHNGDTTRVPIGAWSSFANHGTVVHSETQAYSGDHHSAAWRVFTSKVRKAGHVPDSQTVVNVYPNGAEGDQTAGIKNVGPADAERVGTKEARAMFKAWKQAGKHLDTRPDLDLRWTRACFCGSRTATGPVDAKGYEGFPFLTGSDEGRGPLYDYAGLILEGVNTGANDPLQGDKVIIPVGDPPPAVPLSVVRVGDQAVVSVPGEATKEVGVRIKAAVVKAMRGAGVHRAVIAGLSGDYIQYITTPEEFMAQSYEGASTLYGVNEATFLTERLTALAKDLAKGKRAQKPYKYDPSYGVKPNGPGYPKGAAAAQVAAQPDGSYRPRDHAKFSWVGGKDGYDRPLDAAFLVAQRRVGGGWKTVDTDLGLHMPWRVDSEGRYSAEWQIPKGTAGEYRIAVRANHYHLASSSFAIR
ncbi:MAG: neutral ceramidase [Thermoleophilaceae bacterium]|nr:neutral ceramidase [Thermoleophilaceae bacterium]